MSITLRSRKLRDGRRSLFLDSNHQGKRQFIFLQLYLGKDKQHNKSILEIAHKTRLKIELEQASGRLGVTLLNRKSVNLADFTETFIRNKNFSSQRLYRHLLHHVSNFAGKDVTLQNLNPIWCEDFKSYLLSHVGPNSAANYFGKLKAVLGYAVKQDVIQRNPCDGITIKTSEPLPRYLTLEEIRKLVETPCRQQQVRNAFLFGVMTGLRWSDIKNLKWTDVVDNTVSIRQQKTQRQVSIPLSRWACELLEHQRKLPISAWQVSSKYNESQVFKLPCVNVVYRTLKTWSKNAKLNKSISPHWSRHSFATVLLSQGIDPMVISSLMGHTRVGMTMRYARLLMPRKREIMNQFPQLTEGKA